MQLEDMINTIKLGDCLDIMKVIPDKSVDVSFTSPPYNRKRNDKYKNYDDNIDDYYGFLCRFTNELLRLTKKYIFVNIQKNYYNKEEVFKYIGEYANKIVEIIIWEKTNPMPANGYNITNAYEFFIVLSGKPLKSNTTYTKNIISSSVNTNTLKQHKAVMKQEISDFFITKFTSINDIVLDPFMGIGTTAISCVKNNRKYIGIEIDPEYCKIATDRLKEIELKGKE